MRAIKVLIIADVRLMSDAIAATLADEPDMEVMGAVTSREQAQLRSADYDVVVANSRLRSDHVRNLAKTINHTCPSARIVMIDLTESKWEILRYVEAGAHGYVLNDASVEDMLRAIRAAHDGKAHVSPQVAGTLVSVSLRCLERMHT